MRRCSAGLLGWDRNRGLIESRKLHQKTGDIAALRLQVIRRARAPCPFYKIHDTVNPALGGSVVKAALPDRSRFVRAAGQLFSFGQIARALNRGPRSGRLHQCWPLLHVVAILCHSDRSLFGGDGRGLKTWTGLIRPAHCASHTEVADTIGDWTA
jgi:hypothetical protein